MSITIVCRDCGHKNPIVVKSYNMICQNCNHILFDSRKADHGLDRHHCSKCGTYFLEPQHRTIHYGYLCNSCFFQYRWAKKK